MTRRMRLSDRNVSRLRVEKVEYAVWDTRIPGLGVRVRPSGHKAFVFLATHDGSSKRRSLGPVALMDVDEARNRCLAMQSGVENQAPTIATALLFRDFVRRVWKAECYDRFKSSTRRGFDTLLKSQLLAAFGDMPLARIRPERNEWRYYHMDIPPNLFGGMTLVREWGRLGRSGARRLAFFDDREGALRELNAIAGMKIRRGYRRLVLDRGDFGRCCDSED